MDGDVLACADGTNRVVFQIRIGRLVNGGISFDGASVNGGGGGSLSLVEGANPGTLVSATVITVVSGNLVVGDHGNVVHADPALLHSTPLGGADELDLQNGHFRAVEDLSNDGVRDACAAADIYAGVGVGNDALAGAVRLLGRTGAAGAAGAGLHDAHLDLQILAVNPAVGLLVVVNVEVDLVPAILLFQNGHLGAAVDAAQNLAVQSAGHTDTDGIRVHNGAGADSALGAAVNGDLAGTLDIVGCQVDPAVVVLNAAAGHRSISHDLAPDFLADKLDLVDFHFHALGELEYELVVAASSLSDVQAVADNRELGRDKVKVIVGRPAGLGNHVGLTVLVSLLDRPVCLHPDHAVSNRRVGDLKTRGTRLDGIAVVGTGSGLHIGGEIGAGVHESDLESVVQNARVGNVLVGEHLNTGVGQADPAGGGTTPAVAVDRANLENIDRGILCKAADDLVVHTGIAAGVQIAVVGNGRRGNGGGVVGVTGSGAVIDGAPVGVHQGDPANRHAVFFHLTPGLGFVGSDNLQLRTGGVDTVLGAGSAVTGASVNIGVGNRNGHIDLAAGVIAIAAVALPGRLKQNPSVSGCRQLAPSVASIIDKVLDRGNGGSVFLDGAERLHVLLGGNGVDIQRNQLGHLQCLIDAMHIARTVNAVGCQRGILPGSPQLFAVAACRQSGNPFATLFCGIPAYELEAGAGGGRNMSRGFRRVKEYAVGARSVLRKGADIGIVCNGAEAAGRYIGINPVLVHIDFDLSAAEIILIARPVAHGLQQVIGAGLADDGALDNAAAAHPGIAHVEGEQNQSVMLALGQRQAVGGSKGVDLRVQIQNQLAQSLIGLRLGDGVLACISAVLNHSVLIRRLMLLRADRTVTNAELIGTGYLIAVLLKNSKLLHDRNRGLTGLQRSSRRGQSGGRHQADQHDQS